MGGSGGGVTGWQDGSGVGSGLAHSGPNGSVLRRNFKWFQTNAEDASYVGSGAGITRLSELIPRFLRLSALVVIELGQELGDEYERDLRGERLSLIPARPPLYAIGERGESTTAIQSVVHAACGPSHLGCLEGDLTPLPVYFPSDWGCQTTHAPSMKTRRIRYSSNLIQTAFRR